MNPYVFDLSGYAPKIKITNQEKFEISTLSPESGLSDLTTASSKIEEKTEGSWIDLANQDFGIDFRNFDWKALETMLDLYKKHSKLPRRPRPGYSFWPF